MKKIGVGGFLISIILLIGCSAYADILLSIPNYSDKETLYTSYEIKNLQDNRDVEGEYSGNLFYTKGQENTEHYYYFMTKQDDFLKSDKVKASNTKIKYITDEEIPHIDTYVYYEEPNKTFSDRELYIYRCEYKANINI